MNLGTFCTVAAHKPSEVVHVGTGFFGHEDHIYLARGDGNPLWTDEAGALALAEMICQMYDKEIVRVQPDCASTYRARNPR